MNLQVSSRGRPRTRTTRRGSFQLRNVVSGSMEFRYSDTTHLQFDKQPHFLHTLNTFNSDTHGPPRPTIVSTGTFSQLPPGTHLFPKHSYANWFTTNFLLDMNSLNRIHIKKRHAATAIALKPLRTYYVAKEVKPSISATLYVNK